MEMEKFLRELFEAGRFKHDQNLIDRKVIVETDDNDFEITDITVDWKGDICIHINDKE